MILIRWSPGYKMTFWPPRCLMKWGIWWTASCCCRWLFLLPRQTRWLKSCHRQGPFPKPTLQRQFQIPWRFQFLPSSGPVRRSLRLRSYREGEKGFDTKNHFHEFRSLQLPTMADISPSACKNSTILLLWAGSTLAKSLALLTARACSAGGRSSNSLPV